MLESKGYRYLPCVMHSDGSIATDAVFLNGESTIVDGGNYYLEYRIDGKRIRESVGSKTTDAQEAMERKEIELAAMNRGIIPKSVPAPKKPSGSVRQTTEKPAETKPEAPKDNRLTLSVAVDRYLEGYTDETGTEHKGIVKKSPATYICYKKFLRYFLEFCGWEQKIENDEVVWAKTAQCKKEFLDDVKGADLISFGVYLEEKKGLGGRTCWNGVNAIRIFMRKGYGKPRLVSDEDMPDYNEKDVDSYDEDELKELFNACDPDEKVLFTVFLQTGMREQEVAHLYWSDIGKEAIRVTAKLDWNVKTYKEREITVPTTLIEALKQFEARTRQKECPYIFPSKTGVAEQNFRRVLRDVVKRAGLNAKKWQLHKFRRTFATQRLEHFNTAQVMKWTGHKDLASFMRYVSAAETKTTKPKVNQMYATAM
jgi:integrase